MAAQLAATVYVTDPDSNQTVELAEGTSPEPRLAALVSNPGAWVDGKLPHLPKAEPEGKAAGDGGQVASSGTEADQQTASATKKQAARRTAATRPARGRTAAAEGDSGE